MILTISLHQINEIAFYIDMVRKLYYIYETNFHHHFKLHQQQVLEAQNLLKSGINDQMSVDTSKFSHTVNTEPNANRSLV